MRTQLSKALIVGSLFGGALFPVHSFADVIEMASDPACPSANYATPPPVPPTAPYTAVAGYSCTVTDKTFSGFSYGSLAGTTALDPTTLPVMPITVQLLPGLEFGGNWFAAAGASQSSIIVFTVTTSGLPIGDVTLGSAMGSPAVTGVGTATITEQTCLNGSFSGPSGACSTMTGPVLTLNPTLAGNIVVTNLPTPVTSIGIKDTVTVSGGGNGTGAITNFVTQFSEVPEPATGSLFILGALGLSGVLLRRKTRRRLLG